MRVAFRIIRYDGAQKIETNFRVRANQIFFPGDVVEGIRTGGKGYVEAVIFPDVELEEIIYETDRTLPQEDWNFEVKRNRRGHYKGEELILYDRPAYNHKRFTDLIQKQEYRQEWTR